MTANTNPVLPKTLAARFKPELTNFASLPDDAYIDVGVVSGLLGCSRNTVWRRVAAGILPTGVKIGPNSTRWNVGAIRRYLANLGEVAE